MGCVGTQAIFNDNGFEGRVLPVKIIHVPFGGITLTGILVAPVLPDDHLWTGGGHLGMVMIALFSLSGDIKENNEVTYYE